MSEALTDTTAAAVAQLLARERRRAGSVATGTVLTLVVVTDERRQAGCLEAAAQAGTEHPCRVLAVVTRAPKQRARLDAEVSVGGSSGPGERVVLRLHGPLDRHADSVVLPLLAPDAPVVVWWPGRPPARPADTPLGRLAQRRITDAAAATDPLATLRASARGYTPGDTDLAWTRLTPWRSVLAAALDRPSGAVARATVSGARGNPSVPLLAGWLTARLGVPVTTTASRGPGLTAVRLALAHGEIALTRPDGRHATLSRPGEPDRPVALARRTPSDLLAEELRRLDADETYAAALHALPRATRKPR